MASSRQFQPFSPIDPMATVVVSPEAVDFSSLLPPIAAYSNKNISSRELDWSADRLSSSGSCRRLE